MFVAELSAFSAEEQVVTFTKVNVEGACDAFSLFFGGLRCVLLLLDTHLNFKVKIIEKAVLMCLTNQKINEYKECNWQVNFKKQRIIRRFAFLSIFIETL